MNKKEIRLLGYEIITSHSKDVQQQFRDKNPTTVADNELKFLQAYEIKNDYDDFRNLFLFQTPKRRMANMYVIHQKFKEMLAENDIVNEGCVDQQTQTSWTQTKELIPLTNELSRCDVKVILDIKNK
jgi:hypothetical protein